MPRPSLRHLLALGLLTPWLAGCDTEKEPSPGEETPEDPSTLPLFAREMLDTHNEVRAGAKPTPSPTLEPLRWDGFAQAEARKWVDRCEFMHNPERGEYGENIAAATVDYWDTPGVVKAWAVEASDYDYNRNTCAPGKMCGHYTQIVWRNTKRVGCATQVCTKNSPFGAQHPRWQFWVCNYAPPGNYVGQRPY